MLKQILAATLLICAVSVIHAAHLPLADACELSGQAVAANFQGHSADDVAREVKGVATPRDEYESESAYAERIEQALKRLPPAISNGSLCVVDQNLGFGNTKYDPDSQLLWIDIFLKSKKSWFDGTNLHQDFQIYASERNRKDSSYIGSNAFGASTRVSKLERAATYVTFNSEATT
ncbi:MAG: hypothetical protein ABI379_02590, partial [Rhodanobacter sp.]